jgi:hypothetical protein
MYLLASFKYDTADEAVNFVAHESHVLLPNPFFPTMVFSIHVSGGSGSHNLLLSVKIRSLKPWLSEHVPVVVTTCFISSAIVASSSCMLDGAAVCSSSLSTSRSSSSCAHADHDRYVHVLSVRVATCDCSSPLRSSCVPAKIAGDADAAEDEET